MVDLECVLRAAVRALVLRFLVESSPELARDVARALGFEFWFWIRCGNPRWRGLRGVRSELRELFTRKQSDQLRCRHVGVLVCKHTFQLRDQFKCLVWKLEREL